MTLEARPAFMNKPSSDNSRHQTSIEFRLTPMLLIAALALPANAQLVIKLSSQTVSEFDHYASSVESQKEERWHGRKNFLYVEDDAANKARVLNGEVFIKQMNDGRPVSITDGLIHDWSGAIFIPNTTVERVVSAPEDFDNHKKFYPAVTESKTVRHQGNEVTGYWRLQQKGLVPVILDVEDRTVSVMRSFLRANGKAKHLRGISERSIPACSAAAANSRLARGMDICGA